jgi:hypothetical protein
VKNILSTAFLVIYLLVNSGIILSAHHCCGRIDFSVEFSNSGDENTHCGSDGSCNQNEECSISDCPILLISLKINDLQLTEKNRYVDNYSFPAAADISGFREASIETLSHFMKATSSINNSSIYIDNCTLLI